MSAFSDSNVLLNAMQKGWSPHTRLRPAGPSNYVVETYWKNSRTGEASETMPIDLTPTPASDPAAMPDDEKRRHIVRRLLELTEECGRGYFPLQMAAEGLGLTNEQLYDNNANTGLLWKLGQHGDGTLYFLAPDFADACINVDCEWETRLFAHGRADSH